MTFDVTGLLIFLLAVIPGFLAHQARSRLVPRTLRNLSVLEETRNYIFNGVVVHAVLFADSCWVRFAAPRLPVSERPSLRSNYLSGCGDTATSLPAITPRVSCWGPFSECCELLPNATAGSARGRLTTHSFDRS